MAASDQMVIDVSSKGWSLFTEVQRNWPDIIATHSVKGEQKRNDIASTRHMVRVLIKEFEWPCRMKRYVQRFKIRKLDRRDGSCCQQPDYSKLVVFEMTAVYLQYFLPPLGSFLTSKPEFKVKAFTKRMSSSKFWESTEFFFALSL